MPPKTPFHPAFRAGGWRATLLAAALALPAAGAAVGDWRSYSDLNVPTALIAYHGSLMVGTTGGIRQIKPSPPFGEVDFNNMQGLLDIDIVGFTIDPDDRLWAASRSGLLFRLEGGTWSAWGKPYKSSGWTINPRAVASAGRYIVIGSQQGLSLFDRTTGLAAVNLTKFGGLGRQPVTGVLPRGDTLYIATGSAVLRAPIDWKDATSSRFGATIFDPGIWKPATGLAPVPAFALERGPKDTLAGGDSGIDALASRPVELALLEGRIVAHDSGTLLVSSSHTVKALKGRQSRIDTSSLQGLGAAETALELGDGVFIGGAQGLYRFDPEGRFNWMLAPSLMPNTIGRENSGRVAAVSSRNGTTLLLTGDAVYQLTPTALKVRFEYAPSTEVSGRQLRAIDVLPTGEALIGMWGFGVALGGEDRIERIWNGRNTCLKPISSDGYTVIRTMSDPRGNDIWMTILENSRGEYVDQMAHFDLATRSITCAEVEGDNYHTFATRILNDTLFGVVGDKTMRIYRFGIGGVKASIKPWGMVRGGNGTDLGADIATDGYGRLWALMNGRIGYIDSLADSVGENKNLNLTYLDGFTGTNCVVLEPDVRDGLWAGCENGVFHLVPKAQAELTEEEHYTTNDGLLSDRILDLGMDRSDGRLWIVTENGVNSFQTSAQPVRSGVGAVRAYPNPFRPQHRMLVLDNVPKGATAVITTQSGDAVRRFAAGEMIGNQFQWDGRNGAGAKVTPGIYLYTVSNGSRTSNGKIVVAR
jgi:ligand-binding sensor domain-containing protein